MGKDFLTSMDKISVNGPTCARPDDRIDAVIVRRLPKPGKNNSVSIDTSKSRHIKRNDEPRVLGNSCGSLSDVSKLIDNGASLFRSILDAKADGSAFGSSSRGGEHADVLSIVSALSTVSPSCGWSNSINWLKITMQHHDKNVAGLNSCWKRNCTSRLPTRRSNSRYRRI